jgi:hypothetical protein
MRTSYLAIFGSMLVLCNALLQATTIAASSSVPSPTISWETKFDLFREYILQQPTRNATKGFWQGPSLQKTFSDGECLQIRLYDWDCTYDIPYKMKGIVNWLDNNVPRTDSPIWDTYRYYTYGYYIDPDNGWDFYGSSRLSFGACSNRGPQSSCGVVWCVDKQGNSSGASSQFPIPKGQSPYVDPNDRNRLCPWLRND